MSKIYYIYAAFSISFRFITIFMVKCYHTFEAHSLFINKKYEAFKSKDNYWSSDRDRFVGRFFKKYLGKFFILIDKEVIGY